MSDNNENGYSFWADQASLNSGSTPPEDKSEDFSANQTQETADSSAPENAAPSGINADSAAAPADLEQPLFNIPGQIPATQAAGPEKQKKHKSAGKKIRKGIALLVSAAVFGVVAGGAFIGFNSLYYHFNPSARPSAVQNNGSGNVPELDGTVKNPMIASTSVAQGTSIATADVSDIVEQAMPSLVSISCTFRTTSSFFGYLYEDTSAGSGSGIIVGQNDSELLIATNNHVVDDAITTTVTFPDGTESSAAIKGTDSAADLAIVSVALSDLSSDTLNSIRIATLGDSDQTKVGQMVIAIGNALGYGQTTTVGYLSAKEREITVQDSATGKSTTMTALQVDAAINPGNSGGALLNTKGEVIGINSAKLSGTSIEGIGYAIPISNVIDILTELMNREILTEEEQGYLGVYLSRTDITAEISAAYGWPIGVYVTETAENGAAAKYGILAGDIITAVNGNAVATSSQLQEKINSYRCGTTVSITVQRMENGSYTEYTFDVVLGSKADFDTAEETENENSTP